MGVDATAALQGELHCLQSQIFHARGSSGWQTFIYLYFTHKDLNTHTQISITHTQWLMRTHGFQKTAIFPKRKVLRATWEAKANQVPLHPAAPATFPAVTATEWHWRCHRLTNCLHAMIPVLSLETCLGVETRTMTLLAWLLEWKKKTQHYDVWHVSLPPKVF